MKGCCSAVSAWVNVLVNLSDQKMFFYVYLLVQGTSTKYVFSNELLPGVLKACLSLFSKALCIRNGSFYTVLLLRASKTWRVAMGALAAMHNNNLCITDHLCILKQSTRFIAYLSVCSSDLLQIVLPASTTTVLLFKHRTKSLPSSERTPK